LASFASDGAGDLVSAIAGVAKKEVARNNAGMAVKSLRFIFQPFPLGISIVHLFVKFR
jgi:hypothetical protein